MELKDVAEIFSSNLDSSKLRSLARRAELCVAQ